jgi:peptidoglycan/xylan/chitin deacetylase (PgdA/CDA1 family)
MLSKINAKGYLKKAYNRFTIKELVDKTKQNLLLPFYHTISNQRVNHISNLYPVRNEQLFIKDIDFLLKHFEPVNIDVINTKIKNNELFTKPSFHISFDDGLSELYDTVLPLLEKKGVPATFFINTEFVDNKALFYRYKVSLILEKLKSNNDLLKPVAELLSTKSTDLISVSKALLQLNFQSIDLIDSIATKIELSFEDYLKVNKPYLTTEQIKYMINRGFSIGSHSLNHPFFKEIALDEQKKQLTESFQFLAEKFDIKYKYFSFPFSDEGVSLDFFEWLYKDEKCDLTFGTSGLKHDYSKNHIHRVAFDGALSPAEDIVKSQYFNYRIKDIVGKNKITRS